MVRAAGEGRHPAGVRRLRLRGGRHAHPHLRRHGRVRQVLQRAVRAAGQPLGVEAPPPQAAKQRAGDALPKAGTQLHTDRKQGASSVLCHHNF